MAARDRNQMKRSPASDSQVNRAEFYRQFPDDAACLEWLKTFRWTDGIPCVACGKVTPHYRVKDRPSYSCQSCGHHVHPTAGTIFHKSSTSLRMWFEAIFLMSATRCGVSAKQLERELGVTYKTAWRMFGLIRTLLADDTTSLDGKVEVDETYFAKSATKRLGGPGRPGYSPGERTVLGMVERRGRVVALHVPDAKTATVLPHIKSRVLPSAMVFTDQVLTYKPLARAGYYHRRVNHSARVYVDGDVHTQAIDGFWSLVKRGISGVYHSVGDAYLQRYLDEYSFRYNHRFDTKPMFTTMLERAATS